jgi:hypothetical protein
VFQPFPAISIPFLRDPVSSGRGNLAFYLYPCLLTASGDGGKIATSLRSSQQVQKYLDCLVEWNADYLSALARLNLS